MNARPLLLALLLLATCDGESAETSSAETRPAAPPVSRESPGRRHADPERVEAPARANDTFEPTAQHVALARHLGEEGVDPARVLEGLGAEERVTVLRTALRLDGDAAVAAARLLEWQQLDAWESRRVIDLLFPYVTRRDDVVDFEAFRGVLGSTEIPRLLDMLDRDPEFEEVHWMLPDVHRQVRSEHLPQVARLVFSSNELTAQSAFDELGTLSRYTDDHREELAAAFLHHLDAETDPGGGLPAALRGALRAILAEEGYAERNQRGHDDWVLRWLGDATPTTADAPFLVELATELAARGKLHDSPYEMAWTAVVRAMGALSDDATEGYLRAALELGSRSEEAAASALLRRGDATVAHRLVQRFGVDEQSMALVYLLEQRDADVADDFVRGLMLDRLLDPDPEAFGRFAKSLLVAENERHWVRVSWDRPRLAEIARRMLASDLADPERLAVLGARLPEFRTVAAARRASAALDRPGGLVFLMLSAQPADVIWDAFAFLEVGAHDEFTAALRARLDDADEFDTDHQLARQLLLRLADPADVTAILTSLDALVRPPLESEVRAVGALRSEESRAWLVARLDGGDVSEGLRAALAECAGLPSPVATALGKHLVPADFPEALAELRDGRVVDALLRVIDGYENFPLEALGEVADPRVREFLETQFAARNAGRAHEALAELARAGQSEARTSTWDAISTGRYRWVDNLSGAQLTFGSERETFDFWMGELASNCCRLVPANAALEGLLGFDVGDAIGAEAGIGVTPHGWLRHWRDSVEGDLVWSRIMQAWVLPVR